ncbi:hypothetical protein LZ30DRAFT_609522 [Colletotrichum cereale]|nr:hypothetical protein LZ30DRAFT_609522 [Colletotrichum cereale]
MKISFKPTVLIILLMGRAVSLSFDEHLDKGILPTEQTDSAVSQSSNTNQTWS